MILRLVNRMLVGYPLCENDEYLDNTARFAMDVVATAKNPRLASAPWYLRPIIGRLASRPNNKHYRKTAMHSIPVIKKRLANFKRKRENPDFDWQEPNDYLSWHINLAVEENRPDELNADKMSRRLMVLNFAAIHTSTLTLTNSLLDIVSSDPVHGYVEGVREEATRILTEEGGHWTKAGLARAHRADSAIRESMRINNFSARGLMRKVMPREGITNPEEGWFAPQGAFIGVNVDRVHHEAQIFPDPDRYEAFRFSRSKEETTTSDPKRNDVSNSAEIPQKTQNTGLITTSETFLPFGHGRFACPGRFFVAILMKMILAHVVLNYEVEPLATRPPNRWIGQNYLPPMKAKIRVRRTSESLRA